MRWAQCIFGSLLNCRIHNSASAIDGWGLSEAFNCRAGERGGPAGFANTLQAVLRCIHHASRPCSATRLFRQWFGITTCKSSRRRRPLGAFARCSGISRGLVTVASPLNPPLERLSEQLIHLEEASITSDAPLSPKRVKELRHWGPRARQTGDIWRNHAFFARRRVTGWACACARRWLRSDETASHQTFLACLCRGGLVAPGTYNSAQ